MNQIVTIFSDSNFLGLGLLENLLSKGYFVNIVTDEVSNWKEKTSYLVNKSKFSILDDRGLDNESIQYAIILSGFIKGDPYEKINEIFRKFNLDNSKNLIIIPFEKYSPDTSGEVVVPNNIGIIYLGDLVGPRIDLSSDLFLSRLINQIFLNRKIKLGIGEIVYPMFPPDVVKVVTKWLFSFGPYGTETLLTGEEVSGSDFWKLSAVFFDGLKIEYDEKILPRTIPKNLDIKKIQSNYKFALSEMYKWVAANPNLLNNKLERPKLLKQKSNKTVVKENTKKHPPSIRIPNKYSRFVKTLFVSSAVVLTIPFLALIFSATSFYFSYKEFLKGNDSLAENLLLLSKTFSVVSREESNALSVIPFIGGLYKETDFVSSVSVNFSNIGSSLIPVFRSSSSLTDKIFGNKPYDPTQDSQKIKVALDNLYREISLLKADVDLGLTDHIVAADFINKRLDIEKYKNLSLYGSKIAENLPSILGQGQTKTYLVLFQNNMELRPTGGFVGSFGILTFDSGRITDLTVNDVYSADGQLYGHVEPPAPIKEYLGEANWWLRDSNWDPDFPTSAKRAEWFLDKEMGKSVDGVMAIDLDPVKNILKYTGPIFLPDFNLNISSDNLYEKTQEEVQNNFFPGSRKKASFLTALSRSLIAEVSKIPSSDKIGILKTFYTDLDSRHIQFFLHNDTAQNAINSLSWDGSVQTPSCGDGCYADMVGEVEANLGVNKANYFIERNSNLSVRVSTKTIKRTLDITLKNNSNPALGPAGKYKNYIRFLIPDDASVDSLAIFNGEASESVNPDITEVRGHKEIGFLVEVLGQQTKKIELKWTSNLPQNQNYAKYGIYVRKQAGVGSDPFSLTVNDKVVYNSSLSSDYFDRLNLY